MSPTCRPDIASLTFGASGRHGRHATFPAKLHLNRTRGPDVVIMITHPPDRRLEFFFSGRNSDRAPARQMTRFFFSGRNNDRAPARQTTRIFFSGRNNDRAPARQTTRTFFFGRNNNRAPARQTTRTFFSGSSSPRKAWEVPPAHAKRVSLSVRL